MRHIDIIYIISLTTAILTKDEIDLLLKEENGAFDAGSEATPGRASINPGADVSKADLAYLRLTKNECHMLSEMNETKIPITSTIELLGMAESGDEGRSTLGCRKECITGKTIPVFSRRIGSWQLALHRRAYKPSELSLHYDRAAPGWERMLHQIGYPRAYEILLRELFNGEIQPKLGSESLVLDCGVGTGAMSLALTRTTPDPFHLHAVDISRRMLDMTACQLHDKGLEVTLRQANICRLPYRDNVFDFVMGAHVLEHLVDPVVAVREMVRVLKPGGVVVLCLTRRSVFGMLVGLKWRTHRVTPLQAQNWLLTNGLEKVHCPASANRGFFKLLSFACVGRKPLHWRPEQNATT